MIKLKQSYVIISKTNQWYSFCTPLTFTLSCVEIVRRKYFPVFFLDNKESGDYIAPYKIFPCVLLTFPQGVGCST